MYLPSTHDFLCAFTNRLPGTWKTLKALRPAIAVAPLPSMTPTSKEQRAIVKVVALTFALSACAATTGPVTVWAADQWNTTLHQGRFLELRKANRISRDCDLFPQYKLANVPLKLVYSSMKRMLSVFIKMVNCYFSVLFNHPAQKGFKSISRAVKWGEWSPF